MREEQTLVEWDNTQWGVVSYQSMGLVDCIGVVMVGVGCGRSHPCPLRFIPLAQTQRSTSADKS